MLPEFGGDTYTQTDVYMTGRTNGVATYRNKGFFGQVDGLNFALQYQGNNESAGAGEGTGNGENRKLSRENGDGFGLSTSYDFDFGLSLGAAYSSSDRSNNPRLLKAIKMELIIATAMQAVKQQMHGLLVRSMTRTTCTGCYVRRNP